MLYKLECWPSKPSSKEWEIGRGELVISMDTIQISHTSYIGTEMTVNCVSQDGVKSTAPLAVKGTPVII
jgi:hypothetical protein